jgi:hypothetical protein
MKHIFTFFIIPLLLINTTNQKEDFIGKWVGEDQGEIGYITFDDEGYAAFEVEGQVLGGKEFIMNGEKGKMTYTINYKTKPIEVDLTVTKLESGESKSLLCIAEFKDKNSMSFNMSYTSERPTDFGEGTIVLTRME